MVGIRTYNSEETYNGRKERTKRRSKRTKRRKKSRG